MLLFLEAWPGAGCPMPVRDGRQGPVSALQPLTRCALWLLHGPLLLQGSKKDLQGFPGGASGKGQCSFDPWVGKIHWSRKWQPTPVFLPGESHGQRILVDYGTWGHTESDTTKWLRTHTCVCVCVFLALLLWGTWTSIWMMVSPPPEFWGSTPDPPAFWPSQPPAWS